MIYIIKFQAEWSNTIGHCQLLTTPAPSFPPIGQTTTTTGASVLILVTLSYTSASGEGLEIESCFAGGGRTPTAGPHN